jgi:hypothetical protein
MKRKRVNFNTVQYVKRFDKTLPSNQLSEMLTEPIMTIKKMQPITPPSSPSPIVKLTNDIKDMAIIKKSPPSKSKTKSPPPPTKKKSPTKTTTPTTKSSPAKTTGKKGQSKKSPSSKKSPTKIKRT